MRGGVMREADNAADDARRHDKKQDDRARMVRAYLNRYRAAYAAYCSARAQRRDVLLANEAPRAARITESGTRSKGRHGDSVAAAALKAEAATADMLAAYRRALEAVADIVDICGFLPLFSPARAMLEYVFIDGLRPDTAAEKMGYSRSQGFRMVREGVDLLASNADAWRRIYVYYLDAGEKSESLRGTAEGQRPGERRRDMEPHSGGEARPPPALTDI